MAALRWTVLSVLLLLAAALVAAVLTPSLRGKIQRQFAGPEREILATAEGDLLNDGSSVKVIKCRNFEGLFVEILKVEGTHARMVDKILLPDKHDGLFNYEGHVTRLAIGDIDQDGTQELLIPTFDQQLVPHLNVFRYNSAIQRFEPFQPPHGK
jgi:hypothetical protein